MNKIQTTLTSNHIQYLKSLVMYDKKVSSGRSKDYDFIYNELCNMQNELADQEIMKANSKRRAIK